MPPVKFSSILFVVFLVPTPIRTQEPYRDSDYDPQYYPDRTMHFFNIDETVIFTKSLILDTMEDDYGTKLDSILSDAKADELYEDIVMSRKGYEETVKLLDDMPDDSNITIFEFIDTIDMLFNHDFLRQELYNVKNMCDYTKRLDKNRNNMKPRSKLLDVYNPNKLIFEGLETYDPDEWIQRLKDLDKLYSIDALPNHFDELIQKILKAALMLGISCQQEISINIKLLQCYQYLAKVERERFIMEAAAHQVKYACNHTHDTGILFDLKESLIRRTQLYMTTVKRLMKVAPREIRLCNLKENDNSKYIEADRFYRMSLKEAVSDVDQNEVITGVAFGTRDDIIYPRIQTSILSSNGQIRTKKSSYRFEWEELPKEPQNDKSIADYIYFGVGKSQIQSIYLDDIYVDNGYVVTGVKFVAIPNVANSVTGITIGLRVRATKFDFATGKLGLSKWISGKTPIAKRMELKLGNLYNPFRMSENLPDTVDGQYVKFQNVPSGDDGKTTTVPFFDGHSRTVLHTYPLGGVGLYHNGAPGSGGYISFKLISYDPSIYMSDVISQTIIDTSVRSPSASRLR